MESSSAPPDPSGKGDGNSTTPACDQCRLRKIRCNREIPECLNCRKAGVSCEFSNRGKRVNHTRQLYVSSFLPLFLHSDSGTYRLDDFSGLGARLDSIDQSLANISRRFSSADQQTSPSASRASDVDDELDIFYKRQDSEGSERDTTTSQQSEVFHGVHQKIKDCGNEQYHGSTSALCLILSSRQGLRKLLGTSEIRGNGPVTALAAKDSSLRMELRNLYDSFPFVDSCREPDFSSDGKAVSSPPRSFIHTIIDCFLSNINATRPIFQEPRLKSAIEHNDSGQVSESTEARNLCFSNIILLTLGLKSRLARRNLCTGNDMDDDLLMSFWKNSRRAFGHLNIYLEPRLINVQALATLVSSQSTMTPPLVDRVFYANRE